MIVPHFRLILTETEKAAAQAVLESGMLAQGPRVAELEQTLALKINKKYACAVASGTEALILALKALAIGPDDEVILPSYTCTALWHAVQAVGAEPVLADIELETFNLDPVDVRRRLTQRTKTIIFPHMFGQPGRIQEVVALGVPVIEDIAQAYGASIGNQPVGSFGTLSIISFYATKIIGAGEGGAVISDSAELIAKIRDWREYDEKENLIPRRNSKMTDVEAAIALARLANFSDQIPQRQSIHAVYASILQNNLQIPAHQPQFQANYYRCIARFPHAPASQVITRAQQQGITLRRPVFRPIHLYMQSNGLPFTEKAWQEQVSLPIFPGMSEEELSLCTAFLKEIQKYE